MYMLQKYRKDNKKITQMLYYRYIDLTPAAGQQGTVQLSPLTMYIASTNTHAYYACLLFCERYNSRMWKKTSTKHGRHGQGVTLC